jgi:hypothetical protein
MNADLMLRVHVPGAEPDEIGDEIWQTSLAEAIAAEAEAIAENAGADLLESPSDNAGGLDPDRHLVRGECARVGQCHRPNGGTEPVDSCRPHLGRAIRGRPDSGS